MSIILFLALLVFALISLYKAKSETPANRALRHNEAKIWLSAATYAAGDWLLGFAIAAMNIAAFNWIITLFLIIAALAVMIGGFAMAIVYIKRTRSLYRQVIREAEPWLVRQ